MHYTNATLQIGWSEAQTNAFQACPKIPFHSSPLSLLFTSTPPFLHNLSSFLIPPHPYPHGWGGPSVAGGDPLGITRFQFFLHLACREME